MLPGAAVVNIEKKVNCVLTVSDHGLAISDSIFTAMKWVAHFKKYLGVQVEG